MCRETFECITNLLRLALEKQTTNIGRPIDHRRRIAIVIWWLATRAKYCRLASLFGDGFLTLCGLATEVCFAIKDILLPCFISLPSGQRLQEAIAGFERRGFPSVRGR